MMFLFLYRSSPDEKPSASEMQSGYEKWMAWN